MLPEYPSDVSYSSIVFCCSAQVEVRGCCALFFDLAYKLGCEELGNISEEVMFLTKRLKIELKIESHHHTSFHTKAITTQLPFIDGNINIDV